MAERLVSSMPSNEIALRRAKEHRATVRFLKSVFLFAFAFPLAATFIGFLAQKAMLVLGMQLTTPLMGVSLVDALQLVLINYLFLFGAGVVCGMLLAWNETYRTQLYFLYLVLLGALASVFLPFQFVDLKDMGSSEVAVGHAVAFVSATISWFAMKSWRDKSESSSG